MTKETLVKDILSDIHWTVCCRFSNFDAMYQEVKGELSNNITESIEAFIKEIGLK